jgi:hypothetical protein
MAFLGRSQKKLEKKSIFGQQKAKKPGQGDLRVEFAN